MTTFLGLNDLYRQLPGTVPDDNGMGGAHFNIIKVEDLVINGKTKHTSYSRRSFLR
jgi:AraC family transcriptional regulator, transcriptional activator of pobA